MKMCSKLDFGKGFDISFKSEVNQFREFATTMVSEREINFYPKLDPIFLRNSATNSGGIGVLNKDSQNPYLK